MCACVQIKWGEARTDGDCIVCRKICKGQLLYPRVRAAFNIWPQEVFQHSDRHLRQAIRLWVEGHTELEICSKLLEQFLPKAVGEPRISIRDNDFWYTMMFEHMIDEVLGIFFC